MEDKACNQNGHEHVHTLDNGGFYSGGMCQTDIEKQILNDRLQQAEPDNFAGGSGCFGQQRFPVQKAAQKDGKDACQGEPVSRKQNLSRRVRGFNLKQFVSDFNTWKCTSPPGASYQCACLDHKCFLQPVFCLFHNFPRFLYVPAVIRNFLYLYGTFAVQVQ